MRSWASDNPKAALMQRKREAIVAAAIKEFLENGYARTSMDRISATAGVSVKTVYRHFENKDELFDTVIQAACSETNLSESELPFMGGDGTGMITGTSGEEAVKPALAVLTAAGIRYLNHALSETQLALYRVVTQDAHCFPEIGRMYREEVVDGRNRVFREYVEKLATREDWKPVDYPRAANVFFSLLRTGLFTEVLHGLRTLNGSDVERQAQSAAECFLILLKAGKL
ncbi:TetR/AcrR family transcriptional regulator [Paenibacillus sp. R14(2021)]|uniref:TetR/AcrR family transcriptional regulator n=1 Tax=Paenibacillus sp. R14(2021) TaxID=2859228 RepID=UPI001C612DD1|nr:TetR/AcrR family transcriptional regulator [Paenibacillus sp. R14(2021)]